MKDKTKKSVDELRPEYRFDYSKAVRGKYYQRLIDEGSNVVILEPDIAKAFHDSVSVNKALRSLLELTRSTKRLTLIRPPMSRGKSNPYEKRDDYFSFNRTTSPSPVGSCSSLISVRVQEQILHQTLIEGPSHQRWDCRGRS